MGDGMGLDEGMGDEVGWMMGWGEMGWMKEWDG